jgi:hypothetical protein
LALNSYDCVELWKVNSLYKKSHNCMQQPCLGQPSQVSKGSACLGTSSRDSKGSSCLGPSSRVSTGSSCLGPSSKVYMGPCVLAPRRGLCVASASPCYTPSPRPAFCLDKGSPDEMFAKQPESNPLAGRLAGWLACWLAGWQKALATLNAHPLRQEWKFMWIVVSLYGPILGPYCAHRCGVIDSSPLSCIERGCTAQKRVSFVCVCFDFIMLCRSVLFVTNASDMLSRFEKHAAPTLLVHRFPKCVSLVVIRGSTPNFGGSLGCKPCCAISYVHVVLVLTCLRACSKFGLDYRIGSAMWSWRRAACRAPLQGLCFAAVVPCYAPSPRPAFCMDTGSPDEMLVKQK